MTRHQLLCVAAIITLGASQAQDDALDNETIALVYHKVSGDPLDVAAMAAASPAVQRASNFDRPDVTKQETARLQGRLDTANPAHEFSMKVNDTISEYDHQRAEFSINLFSPGHYLPIQAFRQQYMVVFANAESMRPIPMPKEEARAFDEQLRKSYRAVVNEIRFKIIGKGDPSGAVTGAKVVRAEITSTRLVDKAGRVVFAPKVTPYQAPISTLDIRKADVAGLRVGVKGADLEATFIRLFGPATRRKTGKNLDGYVTTLVVNEMRCRNLADGRHTPTPGQVCVTALLDGDDIVRSIWIDRIFPFLDAEIFRKGLTQKYGPVASASGSGAALSLGWGPEISAGQSGKYNALTANFATFDDFYSRSGNRIPDVRLTLRLVDAEWVSKQKQ